MMKRSEKIVILIPDGESGTLIHVLRCLSEIRNLDIIVLSTMTKIAVRYSRYISTFEYFPESHSTKEWISHINTLSIKYSVDVILPSHESSIRKLIEHKHLLQQASKSLLLPSIDSFELAIDKERLSQYLQKIGIPTPKYCPLKKLETVQKGRSALDYPLLLKPTQGDGGKGILRFEDSIQLNDYLSLHELTQPYLVQEFVEGTDLGFNVLCRDGEILAYTIQLGTLFQDQEFMPQIGLKMIHEEIVLKSMKKLLKSLNWSGVAHIDLMYNMDSRKFNVLEINPRFWQTVQASSFADVNFPWLYCKAVLGHQFEIPNYQKIEYFTLDGIVKKLKSNPLFACRVNYIWKHSPLKYVLSDPAIYIFHVFNKAKKKFSKT